MVLNLKQLEEKYKELEKALSSKEIIFQPKELAKVRKEYGKISKLLNKTQQLACLNKEIEETEILSQCEKEQEMQKMFKEEIEKLKVQKEVLEKEIEIMLIVPEEEERNIIMEIRAAAGGDEAGLFAADLFRMYSKYAESQNWKVEIIDSNISGIGGFKEIIFIIEGKNVYNKLKYEQGVHRIQRVPVTEASGRIHTSTVTVAVLPEAKDVEIEISPQDLRIDVFRSAGRGGQSVNTTDSAVRIVHLPTNIVVQCQDERSQHKNKAKAMRVLKARLLEVKQKEEGLKRANERKIQIGSGDRSEKIRTYNFPQNRVTEHRLGVSFHKLQNIIDGDLEELIELLIKQEQNKAIEVMGIK